MNERTLEEIHVEKPLSNAVKEIETTPLYLVERGSPHPLGAIPDETGVNFSVFADGATSVELLLFDEHDSLEPTLTILLTPKKHKTFHFWHVYLRGGKPGIHYAYRVDGQNDLYGKGSRYNRNKVLIDPYARGNTNTLWNRVEACNDDDNIASSMRSIVINVEGYDWEGDRPLNRLMSDTIIYEVHVRGFTQSSSANSQNPGTFAGVIDKIPYLQSLGITAIELLPIFDFDNKEIKGVDPIDGTTLVNYWGYDPISFFAPQSSYCVSPITGNHITEFRDMVKALHKAGIEVILDVVFNHSSEGDQRGPTINLRGFANGSYYLLSHSDMQYYMNYSGCGNTLYCNHPNTEKLIIDTLEFWVKEMHVDGFRFDEAVILSRDENGAPMIYPPVIWQIELSETLADTKVIAEAWDAGGLYEVGFFPGYRWGEWNGRYRDAIRRFIKGDQGYMDGKTIIGRVADVVAGSADIFEYNGELPTNSVNFITCHDGFTLNDLVTYNDKHNQRNGEDNTDGISENLSWNCGMEGVTDNVDIEALRKRQIRNFIVILMISQGVPMFVAGDEIRRTQGGNNNAYCQDNESNWFDWKLAEENQEMFQFFKQMITFRKSHPTLRRREFFTGQTNQRGLADLSWHGCLLNNPGWNDPTSRVLAFTLGGFAKADGSGDVEDIHAILNMEWEDLDFEVPLLTDRKWYTTVNTFQPLTASITETADEPGEDAVISGNFCRVKKQSIVILTSH